MLHRRHARVLAGLLIVAATVPAGGSSPALSRVAKLLPHGDGLPGNPGALFGNALALDGDTAVVGAPGDGGSGAAVVFVRVGGTWIEQARLRASDGAWDGLMGDSFGAAVAVAGDLVVVGAPNDRGNVGFYEGSAYVFRRFGEEWIQEAKLVAPAPAEGDWFGYSVGLEGETVFVGAFGTDLPGTAAAGSVRVFQRAPSGWSQVQTLLPSDPVPFSGFGRALSASGDRLVVGAWKSTSSGVTTGAAYVYVRQGDLWLQEQKLVAPEAGADHLFGASVSMRGDVVAIGAYADGSGSAYVFERSTTWLFRQKILAADLGPLDRFGFSVALAGDTVLVGAPHCGTPAGAEAGAAYVFRRSGAAWVQANKIVASPGAALDRVGWAVAVSLDAALVGAAFDDTISGEDAGSAVPLGLSGGQWVQQPTLFSSDDASREGFGSSLALAGDTLVVAAGGDRVLAGEVVGSAYVFVRTPAGWHEEAKLFADDGRRFDEFGYAAAAFGDTVVLGAPGDDVGFGRAGSAYVFERTGDQWKQRAKLIESDPTLRGAFGTAVAMSGDTLVVGAPGTDLDGLVDAGAVYLFVRSGEGWMEQARLAAGDRGEGDQFGGAVSISGDLVAVGAARRDGPAGIDSGAVYVFERSGTAWVEQARLSATGGAAGDLFGSAVSVDDSTVVAGARLAEAPSQDGGAAYVFERSGAAWFQEARLVAGDSAHLQFGTSTALAGDRLVVGSLDGAFAVTRSQGAWGTPERLLRRDGGGAGPDSFGRAVVAGPTTVVAGATMADTQQGTNSGAAYLFEATAKGDFDRDLQTDVLLRAAPGLAHRQWLMNGVALREARAVLPDLPDAALQVAGVDDFDADGQNDLVTWDSTTGAVELWLMNGAERRGAPRPLAGAPTLATSWRPAAAGDFNGDGNPDLLWHDVTSRKLVIWTMNGLARSGSILPQPQEAAVGNWAVVAALDYDGDGQRDLLWRNDDSGKLVIWFMDASVARTRGQFTTPAGAGSTAWKAVAGGDFGVGPGGLAATSDILWRNDVSGKLVVWYMDLAGQRTAGTFTAPDSPPDPSAWIVAGPR